MIPRSECAVSQSLGEAGELWIPTVEQRRAEEGFGGYRETFSMYGVGIRLAKENVSYDRDCMEACDSAASDENELDEIAKCLESGDHERLESSCPDADCHLQGVRIVDAGRG